ncbi:hypothetical protein [Bosea sp. 117]|uniref:ArnT family glycosyltransferase n=1 Tax=Bosea sp. 117 TaxID=1125973 RepID=UPI0006892A85|nr:hypothetical protein [Bosea sp. 117]
MTQTDAGLDRNRAFRVDQYGRGVAGHLAAAFAAAARSDRGCCIFLVILCLLAFLPGFFSIPPVDRPEARFAQISRQMVESGNLTEVRVGEEARHTRAFGLHWMQAAIVGTAEAIGVDGAAETIWLYRLPSLIGGIAAVLLTFWAALPFVGRAAALLAAIFLAASTALGVGARLALPDALFLAAVIAMMGALGRAYLAAAHETEAAPLAVDRRLALIFWGAFIGGIFVRGVMAPLYPVVAIAALIVVERSVRFLRPLAPLAGLAACVPLAALWYYLRISPMEDPAAAALRGLVGRVAQARDGVGAPPGLYLITFWGMFWPAAPLAALATPIIWKARRLRSVRFLLAWVLPVWVLLEFWPAKLPAWSAPTFPAIAILIALAMERGAMALSNMRLARLLWFWPLVGAAIAVGALLGLAVFDRTTSFLAWPLLLAGFFALVTAAMSVRDYGIEKASLLGIAGMLVSGFGVMQMILPEMGSVWIAPRLVELARQESCPDGAPAEIASAGYSEPSLMFLYPGRVRFMDGSGVADFLAEGGCRAAFVERRQEPRFARRAEALGLRIERGEDVRGFSYNAGRRVRISLYRNAARP